VTRICGSWELPTRFPWRRDAEGFAYRAPDGAVRAFVNVCPHRAQPVALGDGRLFNAAGEIECQAHGARFDPLTGACVGGPCLGAALVPLPVAERDGAIWLLNGGA